MHESFSIMKVAIQKSPSVRAYVTPYCSREQNPACRSPDKFDEHQDIGRNLSSHCFDYFSLIIRHLGRLAFQETQTRASHQNLVIEIRMDLKRNFPRKDQFRYARHFGLESERRPVPFVSCLYLRRHQTPTT